MQFFYGAQSSKKILTVFISAYILGLFHFFFAFLGDKLESFFFIAEAKTIEICQTIPPQVHLGHLSKCFRTDTSVEQSTFMPKIRVGTLSTQQHDILNELSSHTRNRHRTIHISDVTNKGTTHSLNICEHNLAPFEFIHRCSIDSFPKTQFIYPRDGLKKNLPSLPKIRLLNKTKLCISPSSELHGGNTNQMITSHFGSSRKETYHQNIFLNSHKKKWRILYLFQMISDAFYWFLILLKRLAIWFWTGNTEELLLTPQMIVPFSPLTPEQTRRLVIGIPFPDHMKHRFDFASYDSGARIVDSSPAVKNVKATQRQDSDSYLLAPCDKPIWFVMSFNTHIYLRAVALVSQEFFSSTFRTIELLGSDTYPTRHWRQLAILSTKFDRSKELFDVRSSCSRLKSPDCWVRFIKFRVLDTYRIDHYGYCTLNRFQVFGSDVLESLDTKLKGETDYLDNQSSLTIISHQPPQSRVVSSSYSSVQTDGLECEDVLFEEELDLRDDSHTVQTILNKKDSMTNNTSQCYTTSFKHQHTTETVSSSLFGAKTDSTDPLFAKKQHNHHESNGFSKLSYAHQRLITDDPIKKNYHQPHHLNIADTLQMTSFLNSNNTSHPTISELTDQISPNIIVSDFNDPILSFNSQINITQDHLLNNTLLSKTHLLSNDLIENITTTIVFDSNSIQAISNQTIPIVVSPSYTDTDHQSFLSNVSRHVPETQTTTILSESSLHTDNIHHPNIINVSDSTVQTPRMISRRDPHQNHGTNIMIGTTGSHPNNNNNGGIGSATILVGNTPRILSSGPSLLGLVDRVATLEHLSTTLQNITGDLLLGYRYLHIRMTDISQDTKDMYHFTTIRQLEELLGQSVETFAIDMLRIGTLSKSILLWGALVFREMCGDISTSFDPATISNFNLNNLTRWPPLMSKKDLCSVLNDHIAFNQWQNLHRSTISKKNGSTICGEEKATTFITQDDVVNLQISRALTSLKDDWAHFKEQTLLGTIWRIIIYFIKGVIVLVKILFSIVHFAWTKTHAVLDLLRYGISQISNYTRVYHFQNEIATTNVRDPAYYLVKQSNNQSAEIQLLQRIINLFTSFISSSIYFFLLILVSIINVMLHLHRTVTVTICFVSKLCQLVISHLVTNALPLYGKQQAIYILRCLLLLLSEITIDRALILFLIFTTARLAIVVNATFPDKRPTFFSSSYISSLGRLLRDIGKRQRRSSLALESSLSCASVEPNDITTSFSRPLSINNNHHNRCSETDFDAIRVQFLKNVMAVACATRPVSSLSSSIRHSPTESDSSVCNTPLLNPTLKSSFDARSSLTNIALPESELFMSSNIVLDKKDSEITSSFYTSNDLPTEHHSFECAYIQPSINLSQSKEMFHKTSLPLVTDSQIDCLDSLVCHSSMPLVSRSAVDFNHFVPKMIPKDLILSSQSTPAFPGQNIEMDSKLIASPRQKHMQTLSKLSASSNHKRSLKFQRHIKRFSAKKVKVKSDARFPAMLETNFFLKENTMRATLENLSDESLASSGTEWTVVRRKRKPYRNTISFTKPCSASYELSQKPVLY